MYVQDTFLTYFFCLSQYLLLLINGLPYRFFNHQSAYTILYQSFMTNGIPKRIVDTWVRTALSHGLSYGLYTSLP